MVEKTDEQNKVNLPINAPQIAALVVLWVQFTLAGLMIIPLQSFITKSVYTKQFGPIYFAILGLGFAYFLVVYTIFLTYSFFDTRTKPSDRDKNLRFMFTAAATTTLIYVICYCLMMVLPA